jgi:hypothetical protein
MSVMIKAVIIILLVWLGFELLNVRECRHFLRMLKFLLWFITVAPGIVTGHIQHSSSVFTSDHVSSELSIFSFSITCFVTWHCNSE